LQAEKINFNQIMTMEYKYINNEAALADICQRYKGAGWLAIDTEFEREKTYYPELCLIQIADEKQAAVIDPLAIKNLDALFDLLYDTSITKVFHAARQDLEIFFMMRGAIPQPLFDTQIAAPLVGFNEQIGYGNLVQQMLGVSLGKAHTRTDWKRRPLQEAQLKYAADDVIYLGQVYTALLRSLQQHGRQDWLQEDFAALCEAELYQPDPASVWAKSRNAAKLKGNKLSAFQHLTAWRERTARTENKPRNWLLRDDSLADLAQLLPESISDLGRLKGLNSRFINSHGQALLKIINVAKQQSPIELNKSQARKILSAEDEAKVDALSAITRLLASKNNLPREKIWRSLYRMIQIPCF
jgi:ribonuclease D